MVNLHRNGSVWDRNERIRQNDNWDIIENWINGKIDDTAFQEWLNNNQITPNAPVATFADLPTDPPLYEIRLVEADNTQYIYDGTSWVVFGTVNADGLTTLRNDMSTLESDLSTKVAKGELVENIKDSGAVGDGSDDLPAIQNAIDTVHSNGGGVVLIPKGEFTISGAIVAKNGVSIIGVGGVNESVIVNASNGNAISFPNTATYSSVKLSNFSIRGDNTNFTPQYGIEGFNFRTLCSIDNVRIWRHQKGIKFVDSWYSKFCNIYFQTTSTPLDLLTANGVLVDGCQISGVNDTTAYGINIHGANYTVSNNFIESCNFNRAIYSRGTASLIYSNYIEGCDGTFGVFTLDSGNTVLANYIVNKSGYLIKRGYSIDGDKSILIGNTYNDIAGTAEYQAIIYGNNVTLTGNNFDENKVLFSPNRYALNRGRVVTYSNSTTNRPSDPLTGEMMIDVTLGKPIWYDGTNWVDAMGATV